ncbi:putative ribonuclease H-like domain-containing protein [Tanacetum coccineum]
MYKCTFTGLSGSFLDLGFGAGEDGLEMANGYAMQEEMQQFKFQNIWVLVDLPQGKYAIGTKQDEGIDYDEVFAPVARIEAIRLFLAFASYMGFMVYQMDVKIPTGRVVVSTGRYVVPAGKVIIIVSPGRLSLVPTGRVLSSGRVK